MTAVCVSDEVHTQAPAGLKLGCVGQLEQTLPSCECLAVFVPQCLLCFCLHVSLCTWVQM